MKIKLLLSLFVISLFFNCQNNDGNYYVPKNDYSFEFKVDQFADLAILRYQIPGWGELTLKEKELVYYLTQAGLAGRDIIWDQKYRYNLEIRSALENIYRNFSGDKNSDDWAAFEVYIKRVWFSNGIHHHYSNDKMKPEFSKDYFDSLLATTNTILIGDAYDVIFNDVDSKMVDKRKGIDNVLESAVNFYGPNVTINDVTDFYSKKTQPDPSKPLSYGLNSKLIKENDEVKEVVYSENGLYGESIKEIIKWINKEMGSVGIG